MNINSLLSSNSTSLLGNPAFNILEEGGLIDLSQSQSSNLSTSSSPPSSTSTSTSMSSMSSASTPSSSSSFPSSANIMDGNVMNSMNNLNNLNNLNNMTNSDEINALLNQQAQQQQLQQQFLLQQQRKKQQQQQVQQQQQQVQQQMRRAATLDSSDLGRDFGLGLGLVNQNFDSEILQEIQNGMMNFNFTLPSNNNNNNNNTNTSSASTRRKGPYDRPANTSLGNLMSYPNNSTSTNPNNSNNSNNSNNNNNNNNNNNKFSSRQLNEASTNFSASAPFSPYNRENNQSFSHDSLNASLENLAQLHIKQQQQLYLQQQPIQLNSQFQQQQQQHQQQNQNQHHSQQQNQQQNQQQQSSLHRNASSSSLSSNPGSLYTVKSPSNTSMPNTISLVNGSGNGVNNVNNSNSSGPNNNIFQGPILSNLFDEGYTYVPDQGISASAQSLLSPRNNFGTISGSPIEMNTNMNNTSMNTSNINNNNNNNNTNNNMNNNNNNNGMNNASSNSSNNNNNNNNNNGNRLQQFYQLQQNQQQQLQMQMQQQLQRQFMNNNNNSSNNSGMFQTFSPAGSEMSSTSSSSHFVNSSSDNLNNNMYGNGTPNDSFTRSNNNSYSVEGANGLLEQSMGSLNSSSTNINVSYINGFNVSAISGNNNNNNNNNNSNINTSGGNSNNNSSSNINLQYKASGNTNSGNSGGNSSTLNKGKPGQSVDTLSLLGSLPSFNTKHSIDGIYLFASSHCADVIGYEPAQLLGMSFYDFVDPEDASTFHSAHQTLLTTSRSVNVVYRFLCPGGVKLWLNATLGLICNPADETPLFITCFASIRNAHGNYKDFDNGEEISQLIRLKQENEQLRILLSNLRISSTMDAHSAPRRPASKQRISQACSECGTTNSPEWRKGPNGPKTLCNACGLRYSKRTKQQQS